MDQILTNSVNIARGICKLKLSEGDRAVDATMGNGNDTAFLCELVGESGKVWSFDIQDMAIENTKKRLFEAGFLGRAQLVKDGHENLDRYIPGKIKLAIFNLGYLPKGDHSLTTKSETTIVALGKCLSRLEKGGAALLVIYPGHISGSEEKERVEDFVSGLDQKEYSVARLNFLNQVNHPPELLCIEKR